MPDIYNKQKRSEIMSKVLSQDTKMEILVRKTLFKAGFRFKKNVKTLPGKPDIVLPKYKTIIFIHGCFWHGYKKDGKIELPSSRKEFWEKKINDNVQRDKENIEELQRVGWKVYVLWECELRSREKRQEKIESLIARIRLPE